MTEGSGSGSVPLTNGAGEALKHPDPDTKFFLLQSFSGGLPAGDEPLCAWDAGGRGDARHAPQCYIQLPRRLL